MRGVGGWMFKSDVDFFYFSLHTFQTLFDNCFDSNTFEEFSQTN
jgi:hypothetical protein